MIEKELVKYCAICGRQQTYVSLHKLNRALKNKANCKSCTRKLIVKEKNKNERYRDISFNWFSIKKKAALEKGRVFEFDIKYIWSIYVKQNKVCALSGLPLDFDKTSDVATVSIDRIDNKKGYVRRNIQLLHKDVNFMKWVYDQDYFINLCKLIANHKK
jgi:DNA-directed RNA polymerase subunit RPC12/RpoP